MLKKSIVSIVIFSLMAPYANAQTIIDSGSAAKYYQDSWHIQPYTQSMPDNSSNRLGGGLMPNNSTGKITGSASTNQNVISMGGGAMPDNSGSRLGSQTTFPDNSTSRLGGGAMPDNSGSRLGSQTTFPDNSTSRLGGGAMPDNSGSRLVGSASTNYSVIDMGSGTGSSSSFPDNSTGRLGGGIYPDNSTGRITPERTFPDNSTGRITPEYNLCTGLRYPLDINGHWAEIYIRRLYDLCVVEGFSDNTFRPQQQITRAELVKMALFSKGIEPDLGCYDNDCGTPFIDLDPWQGKWIRPAWLKGVVQGYGYGRFKPNQNITRAEAVKVILATYGFTPSNVHASFFNDVHGWSVGWVERAHELGIVQGTGLGKFDPNRAITRAEAAKIVAKMIEYWGTPIPDNYKIKYGTYNPNLIIVR
jgi:hypothetical protein